MPFTREDLYSVSAGSEMYNYFNPFVTKFDSQSFYNWEEDNQPLYDLEERTNYLWEKATGYAPSALNGMPLVVSGSLPGGNNNIFLTLQAAVDALPNVIRTPTLIEVAVSGLPGQRSGVIGGLDLKNIKCEGDGILEIINRGFIKIYSGAGNGVSTSSLAKAASGATILKELGYFHALSSADVSATVIANSVLSVDTKVSSIFDSRFARIFVQAAAYTSRGERNDRLSLGISEVANATTSIFTSTKDEITLDPYEAKGHQGTGVVTDETVETLDVSSVRGDTGAMILRNNTSDHYNGREVGGLAYFNALSSITVDNCNGPIYIRGFCVDGVSGAAADYLTSPYKTDIGIVVNNSTVNIENCSVMRNGLAGAKFTNSTVNLNRGFFANRNYRVLAPGTARSGGVGKKTKGIHAVNSAVYLNSHPTYASGGDFLFNTQNHDYGVLLENSILRGGQLMALSTDMDATIATAYNKVGIKSVNSSIEVSGNLDVYNNVVGIDLVDSYLSTDRLTVENQTLQGIKAVNSKIEYNNTRSRKISYGNDVSGFRITETLFHRNGSHLDLDKSTFTYFHDASNLNIPTSYGALRLVDSHGVATPAYTTTKLGLPAIGLKQSVADLLHARVSVSAIVGGAPGGVGGLAVRAADSSIVNFLGTRNGATIVQGPQDGTNEQVGILAIDNSKVSFRGPTVVAQFGTGALAENNSTLEFTPHCTTDGTIDPSGFNLDDYRNHTVVEIHSNNNTCLAANRNSQIVMRDLGSPATLYPLNESDYDQVDIAKFVSGGSMQFYPNPGYQPYIGTQSALEFSDAIIADDQMSVSSIFTQGVGATDAHLRYSYYIENPLSAMTTYLAADYASPQAIKNGASLGGLCVQLFGNSVANVNGVHFPCGYVNPRGTYYDPSGDTSGANQLFIWNVGDDSLLNMSHIAVSGLHPSATIYHGPRSTFVSATPLEWGTDSITGDTNKVAYGALAGTPDTGILSVCDLFGLAVVTADVYTTNQKARNGAFNGAGNSLRIGKPTYENKGPFRLFFSTDPAMRYVGYASGGVEQAQFAAPDNRPLQHLAQGYSLSSSAGVNTEILDATGTYTSLIRFDATHAAASGYYYGSGMMQSSRGFNAILDETAANTFANAKNCAVRQSGRGAPKVGIYKSTFDVGGEANKGQGAGAALPYGTGLGSTNVFDSRRKL